jgi:hypothetical protein
MQGQGTAASMTEDFIRCLAGIRENLGLYRTLVAEFAQHSDLAVGLLSEDPPHVFATKIKIVTVASIVAAMHKASFGDEHKQARMLTAEALMKLDEFGMKHFNGHFLNESRMRPVVAQDLLDRSDQSNKKKGGRNKEGSSSAQT